MCKKKEIEEYLSIKEICYCTDKTNFSGDYSRNIIRNDILSVASEKVNSRSIEHICELGNEAQELINFSMAMLIMNLHVFSAKKLL